MELLFQLSETHGTTLILITHDMALAEHCRRVISMADGKIVRDVRRTGLETAESADADAATERQSV